VAELTAESGATGTVSVNPKYGQVAPGKDVTLTAKAAKGSVFHRWEITGVDTEGLDLSSATLKFKMTDAGDVFATAVFVTAEEDAASLALDLADAKTETDGALSLDLGTCVSSLSLTKLTVAGLPAGLKYDAKTMTISGKATKPGLYTVKVTATNASVTGKKAVVGEFTIEVPNFTAANGCFVDGLYNDISEKYTLSVGISNIDDYLPSLMMNSPTAKLAVSGLPSGLKYDAKTGKITGIATRPGTYTVTLTVTEGKAKYVSTITVEVEPLPEILIGTYTGLIGRDVNVGNDDPWMAYGMASVTVAANGNISAKMTLPCGTYSFSAAGWVSAEDGVYFAVMRTKKGDEFELVIDGERDWKNVAEDSVLRINGYEEFRVPLWRNEHVKGGNIESDPIAKELISEIKALKKVAFKVEGSKSSGYEVTELASNDRSANLIVTFDTKGGVKYAGNFDGVRVSGSTFLCIDDDGYYTICDIVVPVGKTESVYIAFGIERDEDGELQFEVDVIRSEFQE
ncbi:MAG: putative Ig domain-containing protein, partial [Kiritimatiellae bacterium]|nr:putative Ig domain-containing protein [Kiritimatiellia bacterium]